MAAHSSLGKRWGRVGPKTSATAAGIAVAVFTICLHCAGISRQLAADEPEGRADPAEVQKLIGLAEEAFRAPATELQPAVAIFPVVDGDRRIRPDGAGLSMLAAYSAAYTPKRRMEVCLPHFRDLLMSARCIKPNTVIDDKRIEMVLAAAEIERFVLPQLIEKDGKLELTFAVKQRKGGDAGKVTTVTLDSNRLMDIPGVIARAVHEHLGTKLDDAEIAKMTTPQVRTAAGVRQLAQSLATNDFGSTGLGNFVAFNRDCVPGWMLLIFETQQPYPHAMKFYSKSGQSARCDELEMLALTRSPASVETFMSLLKYAPQFHSDAVYFSKLAEMAMELSNAELVETVLKQWNNAAPGYAGCQMRGVFLTSWAWNARGGGFANEVTKEGWKLFRERLPRARAELEKAVKLNSLGWEAHATLIAVGMALGLPHEYLDKHFDAAIKLCPAYYVAYRNMFQSLQPRWGGEPAEFLAFACICVKTELWDESIPQLALSAMLDLTFNTSASAYRYTAFSDPDMWETLQLYAQNAQRSAPKDVRSEALNQLARFGAFGGHDEEVADVFRTLEKEGANQYIFEGKFTYAFLRDKVFAKMESGQTQVQAAVRASLDAGDFEKAQEWLDRLDAGSKKTATLRDRFQRAMEVGRDLKANRQIEFTAQQLYELLDGIDKNWKVEGDELVCNVPARATATVLLPFGIDENAEITGTMGWSDATFMIEVHSHTRALRDVVSMMYYPSSRYLTLRRGGEFFQRIELGGNEAQFRMMWNADGDVLEPKSGTQWNAAALEKSPGGFGMQFYAELKPIVVKLKKLRIELHGQGE